MTIRGGGADRRASRRAACVFDTCDDRNVVAAAGDQTGQTRYAAGRHLVARRGTDTRLKSNSAATGSDVVRNTASSADVANATAKISR